MRTLDVLLTNNALAARGGSETYLRDVALALLRRGHRPVAFSLVHGAIADELRRATIPVIDDLAKLGTVPDVVHGHHHVETLIAALTFPGVPIVHFCHGWIPWEETPLRHPSIQRYVAVDEVCADRLIREEGLTPASVEILLNFVDLTRFRPRAPLPARPVRALVFGNYATPDGYVRQIAAACDAAGIALDVVGASAGRTTETPENLLPGYDLVFAKARAALEAMAVGCSVVLSDAFGCGPLVTAANFDRLRPRNFGVRELQRPHDARWYSEQIAAYDPSDAAIVQGRVRAEADLERTADRIVALYQEAILAPAPDSGGSLAASRHLYRIARPLKEAWGLRPQLSINQEELRLARAERDHTAADLERTRDRERAALGRIQFLETALAGAGDREQRAFQRIEALQRAVASAGDREQEAHERIEVLERAVASAVAGAADREQRAHERRQELEEALAAAAQRAARLECEVTNFRALKTLRIRDAILKLPGAGAATLGTARWLRDRDRRK
jgi:hypothetical protein